MTYKILIVDDESANLRLLERLFRRDYYCLTASSGMDAMKLLEQHDVAIVITDQRMPHMTGIDLLKETSQLRPHMVRILLTGYTDVEALVEAINCGLVYMYVSKPWDNDDLKLRISRAIEHYEDNRKRNSLAIANERLLERLKEMKLGFIRVMAEALRSKDEIAYRHGSRVSRYAALVGQTMGLSEEAGTELRVAGLLHDVGILGGSDPGPWQPIVSEHYRKTIQEHSERGVRLLSGVSELGGVADILRFHQEDFDGTGYPRGLMGEQIPLSSRILRVADEYDLAVNPQRLEMSLSHEEAIVSLREQSGKELDPKLVAVFAEAIFPDFINTNNGAGVGATGNLVAPPLN